MSQFAVLLSTYNGDAFLQEQVDSLRRQTEPRVDIWLSDDGSTDATLAMAARNATDWDKGAFRILDGPGRGFAENFRSLICNPDISADYVAFCDQDDVWDADKLEAARRRLENIPSSTPALYCGRTRLVGEDGQATGMSPLMGRPPGFRNALVQSIAGGNTMVMNRAAFELMRRVSQETPFVSHDWWSYLMVSGTGGVVVYDPEPRISYRQHDANLVGANKSFDALLRRYRLMLSGRFAGWNETNLEGLDRNRQHLTPENADILADYMRARNAGRASLLSTIARRGLRRQTLFGNLVLVAGAVLGKM